VQPFHLKHLLEMIIFELVCLYLNLAVFDLVQFAFEVSVVAPVVAPVEELVVAPVEELVVAPVEELVVAPVVAPVVVFFAVLIFLFDFFFQFLLNFLGSFFVIKK